MMKLFYTIQPHKNCCSRLKLLKDFQTTLKKYYKKTLGPRYYKHKDEQHPMYIYLSSGNKGDIINVHSMDRLARNTKDLLNLVDNITNKGAKIVFHKENLTFKGDGKQDPYQKMMMTMLGAVAELERSILLERQREGIALAKARHKYKGGKNKLSAEQVEELKNMVEEKKLSLSAIARKLNISRPTLYSYLKKE